MGGLEGSALLVMSDNTINTLGSRPRGGKRILSRRDAAPRHVGAIHCLRWTVCRSLCIGLLCFLQLASGTSRAADPSVARIWNEEILAAIRIDLPHPPVHARNLFSLSVAMYDAWAAYDPVAAGYIYHDKHSFADVPSARNEAISHAAYRMLRERYALSKGAAKTLPALEARMRWLGYNPENTSTDPSTPAGVGNGVAAAVSDWFLNDGAFQLNAYADRPPAEGGYASVNRPLITGSRETLVSDVNRWQPLVITNQVSQNGIPLEAIQKFLGAQWLGVRPFALERSNDSKPWIDPGPPDQLGREGDTRFREEVVEVIRRSGYVDPDDGITLDISPGAFGNNTVGQNDGHGHSVNPITGKSYPSNRVRRGDFARVLAEFWADGPSSETPPGHWNTLANQVTDAPGFQRHLAGSGPLLDPLEWDVKLYFALNAALHDAACAAWSVKRYYDGGRPIAAIRYMGMLGQSTDPTGFTYNPKGLPLIPGLIEEVTFETYLPGERHAGLPIGEIAIYAWPGQPADPATQHSGARWMLAVDWLPYQKKTFVTPAFPGYISGHSTFSRAAAEVLAAFTGSAYFPGGLGTFTLKQGSFLSFEYGPSQDIQLQWGTYYDAADQAGLSRIYGGIHVSNDDLVGRKTGSQVGKQAGSLVQHYFDGSILNGSTHLTMTPLTQTTCQLQFNTVRGFRYSIETAPSLTETFDAEAGSFRAENTEFRREIPLSEPSRFIRINRAP